MLFTTFFRPQEKLTSSFLYDFRLVLIFTFTLSFTVRLKRNITSDMKWKYGLVTFIILPGVRDVFCDFRVHNGFEIKSDVTVTTWTELSQVGWKGKSDWVIEKRTKPIIELSDIEKSFRIQRRTKIWLKFALFILYEDNSNKRINNLMLSCHNQTNRRSQ